MLLADHLGPDPDHSSPSSASLSIESILRARERIRPFLHGQTPVFSSASLNSLCGDKELFFKCENLQKTGSFKARGAMNAILCALERDPNLSGVVTHSSGNHGQALAWAASQKGLRCAVVVPENAPTAKLEAIRAYGAELISCAPSMESRWTTCERISQERGFLVVDPHDDFDVMSGQGTVAAEFMEQIPGMDAIVVSVGGGGLAAGVATMAKAADRRMKVFCAEVTGKCLQAQLESGQRRPSAELMHTIADGIRVKQIGSKCFGPLCQWAEKSVFSVDDEEIRAATRLLWERLKLVAEPAAGVPLAALLREHSGETLKGCRRIGVVVCGGNVSIDGQRLFPPVG